MGRVGRGETEPDVCVILFSDERGGVHHELVFTDSTGVGRWEHEKITDV